MEGRITGPEVNDEQNGTRGRYLNLGVAWGASLGLALGAGFGAALDNLASGIGIGLSGGTGIGIALGAAWDSKIARQKQEETQ
jgi:hypothetical protein